MDELVDTIVGLPRTAVIIAVVVLFISPIILLMRENDRAISRFLAKGMAGTCAIIGVFSLGLFLWKFRRGFGGGPISGVAGAVFYLYVGPSLIAIAGLELTGSLAFLISPRKGRSVFTVTSALLVAIGIAGAIALNKGTPDERYDWQRGFVVAFVAFHALVVLIARLARPPGERTIVATEEGSASTAHD